MSIKEIERKIKKYKELQRKADEITAEMESIKDELKIIFEDEHTDTITAGIYKVTYKTVTSNRIDTGALKKGSPKVAKKYTKSTTVKRMTIN